MTYLLDTQLLLWSAYKGHQLSNTARALLDDASNNFIFSTTSIWEIAIKAAKRPDVFRVNPEALRTSLLHLAYTELILTSEHALRTTTLPLLHGDPFDRILVAQAIVEDTPLVTADRQLTQYTAPILYVG